MNGRLHDPPQPSLDLETNHRILIVDDNLAIHADFRKILGIDAAEVQFDAEEEAFFGSSSSPVRRIAFDLDFASQGDQALDLVTKAAQTGRPYSVVFMDVRMPPGWDGIETTARLWQVDPDLQVVICTAYSDYSWEKMISLLGNSDRLLILKKPFDTIEVVQIAHALSTKWTLQQTARHNAEWLTVAVRKRTHELEQEMIVRKRGEEVLKFTQLAVDHASDAMYWVDPDARLTYFNAALGKSLGYSADELRGMSVLDIVPTLCSGEWKSFWEILRQELQRTIETRHITKDGREIPIELTVNFFDFDGREFICADARDITRRHQILSELAEARDAALEASRQKSQFLANMSHEIRTPMNGVIGMGELLLHTNLSREQREYIDAIRSSADHLMGIINDILDTSKIDAGEMKFENARFELGQIVESTLDLIAPSARAKGLELAGCLPPDGCNALRGDAGRLKQLLTNMIGNAVKFTDQGEVALTVSVLEETPEDILIHFSIRDTGIGIDAACQDYIFEPFHQADESNTRRHGGTGLGLTICRQIVTALGGQLGVNSEPGVGSEFWFTLRLQRSIDPLEPITPESENLRILIVDDNATNRNILQRQLSNLQMRPTAVASGSEALDFLRQEATACQPIPIAIVDMQMPEMDGITLAKLIKADRAISATRLILLSSLGDHLSARELLEAGVEEYIVKPVKQSRLHESLAVMLGRRNRPVIAENDPSTRHSSRVARVLLAEDNPVNQKVAMLQLKRLGYSADLAADGSEVLAALERAPYDIILMDCQMPVMDGYTATRRIREIYQQPILIIAMTANAMPGDREKCLDAGMDDHLGKPVHLQELEKILSAWRAPLNAGNETAPPVDLARLTEITGSDSAMFRHITADYLEQAEEILALISLAIERRDPMEIHRLAHKLGGSSASCGIVALAEPLGRLERMRDAFQPPLASDLLQQAVQSLQQVRRFLAKHQQTLKLDH